MTPVLEHNRDDDVVRELLAPFARVQPVRLRRRPAGRGIRRLRPVLVRGFRPRFALVAAVLALSGLIASLAIAGTGWLTGEPAPPPVVTDFRAYTPQLGFHLTPAARPGRRRRSSQALCDDQSRRNLLPRPGRTLEAGNDA